MRETGRSDEMESAEIAVREKMIYAAAADWSSALRGNNGNVIWGGALH